MILYRYSTFEIRMNQGTLLRISIGGFEEWKFFLKYVLPLTTSTYARSPALPCQALR